METIYNPLNSPKFHQANAIRELIQAMSEGMQKQFCYGELRGDVLTLWFSHPLCVSEFNLGREKILEKMRQIYKEKKLGSSLRFREVVARTKPYEPKPPPSPKTTCEYKEQSTGEFEIKAKDPELVRIFENIKKIIKERQ